GSEMGEATGKFAALRQELVTTLIRNPSEQNAEFLQRLVEAPLPPAQKYLEIDARGILRANVKEQFQVDLRLVSTAFQILEKYGRNLLHPRKPYFWRMVKFNNPVFRDTVDTIQGGRDVLRLYGYLEQKADGLYFPDLQAEPNIPHVASVTVDVMLLRAELNLLLSETHPNPRMLQELMQGGQALQTPPLRMQDKQHLRLLWVFSPPPLPFFWPAGNLSPDTCLLCGLEAPSQHCEACNQSLCPNCDWLFHKHPSRTHHHRVPMKNPGRAWQSPPPPPNPSLSSIPSETASLRPPSRPPLSASHSLPSPRPPWRCAACQKNNDASSVLCINCDRPRGCKTPQTLGLEDELTHQGQLARGRWSCQTCTFENESATVLCAVCERPRLAGRPGTGDAKPLIAWGEESGPQQEDVSAGGGGEGLGGASLSFQSFAFKTLTRIPLFPQAPSWQCEHCTFRNSAHRRICEMCNCTSLHGDPQPPSRAEKDEVGRLKRQVVEAPGEPQGLWKAPPNSPEEAEQPRQAKLRDDGQKMVAMIREAEGVGVAPEMVVAALCYSGAELPLAWLKSELPCVLEGVAELATQRGAEEPDERGSVLQALYENNGDLWRTLVQLQQARLAPFHQRLWESEDPPVDFQCADRQALLRRLLASLSLPSWGRAELMVSLMLEQPNEGWELADIVEAVKASPNRDFIRHWLSWECAVCSLALPRNKMQSLTSCECTICPECFELHFTIAVKEKHITDLVCPACSEPEISDEMELLNYFSTLDIQHQGLSCEAFLEWKRTNDPEYQAQGLAMYLQENGIACPKCKFSYALARGGCMHFQCSQCRHHFCSGCYGTFYASNVRMLRDCAFVITTLPSTRTPQRAPGLPLEKEMLDGLKDEPCGKETPAEYAGLCE
ncbi:hypothetical protein Chor_009689, partial [Crotalus horridus]